MIPHLKPYPAYKDPGVPWLGEVPGHWEVLPALAAYRPRQVKNTGMIEKTVLSLSYGRIIVKSPEKLRGLVPESFETYQIVDPGNIIVRTTDLQNDKTSLRIGHSPYRGIITSAYLCLETTTRVSNAFGYQFLNAYDLLKIIYGFGSGLRQNLDFGDIKRMPILVPPLAEQAAIVRYLDYMDRRIRRYIRAKQKLITLLEEQKQAIIHHAVTRGLDPNVRLKPSGVEWLGDVPEHWEVTPNRAHLRIRKQLVGGRHSEYQLLSLTKRGVIIRDLSENKGKFSSDMGTSQTVRTGDLVFCLFDVPETPRTVGLSSHAGMITGAYTVMECADQKIARFLEVFYIAMDDRKLLSPLYSGLRNTIRKERFLGTKTPVPPPDERDAILEYMKRETIGLDEAMDRTAREITLLREYRTRLIADVVTGKLDVREAAARLPDEAGEFESLDDTDEPIGDAEDEAVDDLDAIPEEVEA